MDAVILYVDNSDPIWKSQLEDVLTKTPNKFQETASSRRYRNWNFLEIQLKLIRRNMPFIDRVFLVVSGQSQIPSFCQEYHAIPILHEDIIPKHHLPSFNSSTIEVFIPKIVGLAEEFVYFNDDIFPVKPCLESDFFVDGKAVCWLTRSKSSSTSCWRMCVQNSWQLANKAAGIAINLNDGCMMPQHSAYTLLKSDCLDLIDRFEKEIDKACSKFRLMFNYTIYLYIFYQYLLGHTLNKPHDFKYYNIWDIPTSTAFNGFTNKIVCLNDMENNSGKNFEQQKNAMKNLLEMNLK